MIVERDASLQSLHTMGLPSECDLLITFDHEDKCSQIAERTSGMKRFVLGGGSNVVPQGRFHGAVIRFTGKNAGNSLDSIIQEAVQQGCIQAASLSGIPGTLGGAAVQNAGAYGSEISDFISCVKFYDLDQRKFFTFSKDECGYGYRTSLFKSMPQGSFIITEVGLDFTYGEYNKAQAMEKRAQVLAQRAAKLPDVSITGSAGSYFKNPIIPTELWSQLKGKQEFASAPNFALNCGVKLSAAWLIEQAGYKGVVRGNAGTYTKHALIVINATGKATPKEIQSLEDEIIAAVHQKFHVTLQPEVVKLC